jgi:FAD/FMN-containing dehydrogenase
MRSYGVAIDNLISTEVVTADGNVVTASTTENPELFWGLRGGGGNFGVATMLEYRLHPVSEVLAGMLLFPFEQARDFLRLWRSVTQSAPDQLGSFAGMLHGPDGSKLSGVVLVYNGPTNEGERVIKPFREFGAPTVDSVSQVPYPASQTILDEGLPPGHHSYWRSHFLTGLPDELIDAVVERYSQVPSPLSLLAIEHMGGAVARVGREETAFNLRDYDYNILIIARWADPAEAPENIAWTRDVSEAAGPYANGVYVNYLGVEEQADRVRAAYGEEKYARLVELKNQYDPQNRFCFNQNIKPTG